MLGLEAAGEVPAAGGAPKSSLEPKASPKAAAACGGAEVESTRGGRGNYGTYRPITTERTCAGAEVMSTPPSSCRSSWPARAAARIGSGAPRDRSSLEPPPPAAASSREGGEAADALPAGSKL